MGSKKTTIKLADVKDILAKETGTHAAQCHRMMAERCPHGRELNMRLWGRLDPVSWEAGRRLAKGVSFESIYRNAGIDPR